MTRRSALRPWLVFAVAVSSASALAAGPVKQLVGVVSEQRAQVCLGNQQEDWTDPHLEAGFVRLVPGAGVRLSSLVGAPALLTGHVDASLHFPPPAQKGECPGRQARSDWVFTKDGVRLLRQLPDGVARPESFTVDKAARFDGVVVEQAGDELVVRFTNPVARPLSDVELIVHYEGCYGKPLNPSQRASFPRVDAGQTVTARLPVHYQWHPPHATRHAGRELHVASSVQVTTKDPSVLFDLDLPISRFPAVKAECPKRDGRK